MKKLLSSILAVAALAGIQAFAQEEDSPSLLAQLREDTKCSLIPSSIKLSFDYKSRYLSDGRVINPQNMLFGSVDLAWDFATDGIYVGIWGANDLNRYNHGDRIEYEPEEFDYYIGYWYEFGGLGEYTGDAIKSICLDVSYTYWDYPSRCGWEGIGEQQNTFTIDVSAGLGVEAIAVKPGFKVNWDPENEKIYGNLYVSLGKDFEDAKWLSVGTRFDLFWGNGNYVKKAFGSTEFFGANDTRHRLYVDKGYDDIDKETFTTFIWTVSADFTPFADSDIKGLQSFTIGPFAQLVWALDHECRESWKTTKTDNSKSGLNTCYGISASYKF